MLNKNLFKEKIGMFNVVVNKQLDAIGQQMYFKKLEHLNDHIFNETMDNLFEKTEKYWSVPSVYEILQEYTNIVSKNNSIFNKIMIDSIKLDKKPRYKELIDKAIEYAGGWNYLKINMSIENSEDKINEMRNKFYEFLIKNNKKDDSNILGHHNHFLLNR